ncbi:related to UDP-glucose:glycoprotein glucosyltransferase precursor [Melanopsichium pennsylvanicum]|uniref:Related to UDP-glucose:glycoprotein glucosyltransferase n=2 Tax=Melanopsichium pennsylvanicum TaxID=63383 RepID=A0AAJ5C489_9BASI|nr:related to UDP-glucose:glycoprotein glucosyltransferase precursor [Melanopsichium pennsylvanicum 4]SNX83387.1 related to UDP-glucose:glycoprotein glucosyltransferase precursor [Melanopsichium pennsylvanicum]
MRARQLLGFGWAWLALSTLIHLSSADESPPVKVQLRPSWASFTLPSGGSPFLLELLEAAHSQRPSSFFPLLKLLTTKHTPQQLHNATDEWLANRIENLIRDYHLFGKDDQAVAERLDLWRMGLALKHAGPRIEAHKQAYQSLELEDIWNKGNAGDSSCVSWVHHQDLVLCSAEDVKRALLERTAPLAPQQQEDQVVFGHPRTATATQRFVLYADPYSVNFQELLSTLDEHTSVPSFNLSYTLRWRPQLTDTQSSSADHPSLLSGYGAILDLKKVDYLVIDDRKLKDDSEIGDVGLPATSSDESSASQAAFAEAKWLRDQIGADPDATTAPLSKLSEDEIADLGIKAAQLIMQSSDRLRALRELSQNFPLHASALASSTKFEDDSAAALIESVLGLASMRIEPGHSDLWLNGQSTSTRDFIPLKLLDTLRRERRWFRALQHRLAGGGLNTTEAGDLISSSLVGRTFIAQTEGGGGNAIFDASDRIEKKQAPQGSQEGAITWLNDLENDEATRDWSSDLMDLLRPMWPGKFPRLRLNLFNVVLVLDLTQRESCRFLSETVIQSLGRVGLHWGLVPGGLEQGEGDSLKMARLFWFLLEEASPQILSDVLRKAAGSRAGTAESLDVPLAIREAKFSLKSIDSDNSLAAKLDLILSGSNPAYNQREELAKAYICRLRATNSESPTGHVFTNGQRQPFHPQIVHMLHQSIQEQIQVLAPQIYYGQLKGSDAGLSTWFYDAVGALSFRSALVGGTAENANGAQHSNVDLFSALVDESVPEGSVKQVFQFYYPINEPERLLNSTVWVFANVDTEEGLGLVRKAFEALTEERAQFRLGVLHIPSKASRNITVSTLLYRLLNDNHLNHVTPIQMLDALNQSDSFHASLGLSSSSTDAIESAAHQFWTSLTSISTSLALTGPAIIVDGHLVSNFGTSTISHRDITALVEYEAGQKLPYLTQALQLLRENFDSINSRQRQDLIFASLCVMNGIYDESGSGKGVFTAKATSRSGLPEQIGTSDHVFEIGDKNTANIRITLLLDPLSEAAQRWSSILVMLQELEGVWIRVILNPQIKVRELPLKRFYRFSAPNRLHFDEIGKPMEEELRFFTMPQDAVLTLGLDAPAPWLTMPTEAVYDLDNIRLSDVPSTSRDKGVKAVYELKHILIEGHAREESRSGSGLSASVPRGLQLILETPKARDEGKRLDTIVMANLAYFQFKAQPGLWKLGIRQGGRSGELYEMVSVGGLGWDSPKIEETGQSIILDTLSGLTVYPRVAKRAGKENEELLEELDAQGRPLKEPRTHAQGLNHGVAASASQLIFSAMDKLASFSNKVTGSTSSNAIVTTRNHADINIFTVASGHLYERMTYIMILSVLKHTNSTVKFWFIENFLSPSFKEFIPHLAQEYGFEYELVTYAWPHWLRSQKEKQRTIWGYKILFLDTLFPLNLGKVIFVDADQVVRTDMKELVDLDLEGKVYGYPPMGDDSEDMDGFRFWKQGYWKDYLRGRPYHISALYVVDLNKFRLFAAGDRLRGQYQALSADPNSLSNLDQDLPNNMQASLPIFTLPKQWLWCETWCSHDWLDQAKTIDLCSNPKTKEPKLDRAKRQIPEWTVYDQEVARLAQRLVEEKRVGMSVVAPHSQVETGREQEALKKERHQPKLDTDHPHDEL